MWGAERERAANGSESVALGGLAPRQAQAAQQDGAGSPASGPARPLPPEPACPRDSWLKSEMPCQALRLEQGFLVLLLRGARGLGGHGTRPHSQLVGAAGVGTRAAGFKAGLFSAPA